LHEPELALGQDSASLEDLRVIWRDGERGNGGQFGAQIAFSPDGPLFYFLQLAIGSRMTPAQDPNQPLGQDSAPDVGWPSLLEVIRWRGRRVPASVPVIDPPADTEAAKTAPVVRTYTFPGPNLTPAETLEFWTPYTLWSGLRA